MQVTFGKYKGSKLSDIPTDYLEWGARKLESLKWQSAFEEELNKRIKSERDRTSRWLNNLDSEETFNEIRSVELTKINREIQESGCEWEYNQFNEYAAADESTTERIRELKCERDRLVILENAREWAIDKGVADDKSIKRLQSVIADYESYNVINPKKGTIEADVFDCFDQYINQLPVKYHSDFRPAIARIAKPQSYFEIVEFARKYHSI